MKNSSLDQTPILDAAAGPVSWLTSVISCSFFALQLEGVAIRGDYNLIIWNHVALSFAHLELHQAKCLVFEAANTIRLRKPTGWVFLSVYGGWNHGRSLPAAGEFCLTSRALFSLLLIRAAGWGPEFCLSATTLLGKQRTPFDLFAGKWNSVVGTVTQLNTWEPKIEICNLNALEGILWTENWQSEVEMFSL